MFTIIGMTSEGRIVAEDRTDCPRKAKQIVAGWIFSGLEVTVNQKY